MTGRLHTRIIVKWDERRAKSSEPGLARGGVRRMRDYRC